MHMSSEMLIVACCCDPCFYLAELCECQNGIEAIVYVPCEALVGDSLVFDYLDQCYEISTASTEVTDTTGGVEFTPTVTHSTCAICCDDKEESTLIGENCCDFSDLIYVPSADLPLTNSAVLYDGKCYRRKGAQTPADRVPHLDPTTIYPTCTPCADLVCPCATVFPSTIVVTWDLTWDGCSCTVEKTLTLASCQGSSTNAIATYNLDGLSGNQDFDDDCDGCTAEFQDINFQLTLGCDDLFVDAAGPQKVSMAMGRNCDLFCCTVGTSSNLGITGDVTDTGHTRYTCTLPASVEITGSDGCLDYTITVEI